MKRILIIASGAFLFLAITVPFVMALVSPAYIGPKLEAKLRQETGLELRLPKQPRLRLFPSLELQIVNATLVSEQGEIIAQLPDIRLAPTWAELFQHEIESGSIRLLGPEFFVPYHSKQAGLAAANRQPKALSFGVQIEDGEIIFEDVTAQSQMRFTQMNGTLNLKDGLSFMGGLSFATHRLFVQAHILDMGRLYENGSPVDISLRSGQLHFSFSGLAQLARGFALAGQAEIETADLYEFADGFDIKTPLPRTALRFAASGAFSAEPGEIRFSNGNYQIQGMPARGDLNLKALAANYALQGRLGFDRLQLDSLASMAYVAGLQGKLAIAAREIKYHGLTTGTALLDIQFANEAIEFAFKKIALGQGQAQGNLKLNSANPQRRKFAMELSLTKADAQQSLGFLFGIRDLQGDVDLKLTAISEGENAQDMLSRLVGAGSVKLSTGHIQDVDLSALIKAVNEKIMDGWAPVRGRKSEIKNLQADFQLTDGVARSQNFTLENDAFSASGRVNVDFLREYVDMQLDVFKQDGSKLLPVSLMAEGQFTHPKFYPNMPGVLNNPQLAYQAMRAMNMETPQP